MINAETRKLNLTRFVEGNRDVVHHPVVERSVVFEFQRTEGMGNAFERILNRMSEVIHGIDAPFGSLPVVVDVTDAVDHRITHVEVAAGKIDLCAQGHLSLFDLPVLHLFKQLQVFLNRPVAVRRDRRCFGITAVFPELFRCELADIGKSLFDEFYRKLIVLFKIIRAVKEPVAPVKSEPVDILLDRIYVFGVFLRRIGIIHSQIAETVELLRHSEVDADRLAVTDMKIAVRFGRKSRMHGQSFKLSARRDIFLDEVIDKVSVLFFFFVFFFDLCFF